MGSYDWYRRANSASKPGSILLYASRDGGGGRGPAKSDGDRLEAWLKGLADKLGLTYVKTVFHEDSVTMRARFENARVVVAPHGGAITNIVYSHASTLVVEIGSAAPGARFCFACVAFAMRFAGYAIFDAGPDYKTFAKISRPLDVPALIQFWEAQMALVYDRVMAMG